MIVLKQVQDPLREVYKKSTKSTNPPKKVPEKYRGTHTGTIVPVCVPLSVSLLQCIHSTGLSNVLNESKSSQKVYAVILA